MSRLLHQKTKDPNLRAQIGLCIHIFSYKEHCDLGQTIYPPLPHWESSHTISLTVRHAPNFKYIR